MKTVTVSEIIRMAQMGDTRYVLASESEADIEKRIRVGLCENCDRLQDELAEARSEAQERERVLVETLDRVTAYYEGCMQGIKTDNYQDVIDQARAVLAAKEG